MQPQEKRSVALVGMMGAGKTTVGSLLAERIGWTFLDTDLMLEGTFHKPISRIFSEGAEETFRAAERLVARLLLSAREAVVATGGGLWLSPESRARVSAFAWTAYLAVPAGTLWERLQTGGVEARPLLRGSQPRAQLERLAREREAAYALADWRIDAGGSPQDVVRQVLRKMSAVGLVARPGRAA